MSAHVTSLRFRTAVVAQVVSGCVPVSGTMSGRYFLPPWKHVLDQFPAGMAARKRNLLRDNVPWQVAKRPRISCCCAAQHCERVDVVIL